MEKNKRSMDKVAEGPPPKRFVINQKNIKDLQYVGTDRWIQGVKYFGVLRHVYQRENSVIFEFHDDDCIIDCWSSKYMRENVEKLKISNEYYLDGGMMLMELDRGRYNKASNSNLGFSIRLDKIRVADSNAVPPIKEETTNFKDIKESIDSGKRFTKYIKNVTIRYGNFSRYLGCSICKKGIKENPSQEYTCNTCNAKSDVRSFCFMARDIMLKDEFGNTLFEVMANERVCQILITKARLNQFRESFLEDDARAEFEKFYNKKVNCYLKNVEGYTDSAANKLLIDHVEIVNVDLNDEDDAVLGESSQQDANRSQGSCPINCRLPDINLMQRENGYYRTTYSSTGKGCGLALVVNIGHIEGEKVRAGSEVDVESLKSTFELLKIRLFRDQVLEHITKAEFTKSLKDFKQLLVDHDYSISFVIVRSHGAGESNQILLGKRGEKLHIWKDVMHHFGYSTFKNFYGKPKVFVFHGCQNEVEKELKQKKFNCAGDRMPDILYAIPCPPGVKAKRNPEKGTYFIQALIKELHDNADKDHLRDIFDNASRQLQNQGLGENKDEYNTPIISTTSFDKFYFPNFLKKNFDQDFMD